MKRYYKVASVRGSDNFINSKYAPTSNINGGRNWCSGSTLFQLSSKNLDNTGGLQAGSLVATIKITYFVAFRDNNI